MAVRGRSEVALVSFCWNCCWGGPEFVGGTGWLVLFVGIGWHTFTRQCDIVVVVVGGGIGEVPSVLRIVCDIGSSVLGVRSYVICYVMYCLL